MPALSIVIPTYNGLEHLQRCLPSVVAHAPAGSQILVVDDASTDDSANWVKSQFPQVDLVVLPRNGGFCAAANEGLRRATGDVVELLNNDTEVTAGWADPCLRHFQDPTVGSVAPLVVRMDDPNIIDSAGQDYHISGWATDRGHNRPIDAKYLTGCDVFGPSGSSGFYRRSALQRTGGLLPLFGAYFEDTDLAFRLRWAGYRCIYEPAARVLHKGSASYNHHGARVIRLLARNEELVWWINVPALQLILGIVPHCGFFSVRLVSKLIRGGALPFLHGKLQALAGWRDVLRHRRALSALRTGRKINLGLSVNANVVSRGLVWLTRRQCT